MCGLLALEGSQEANPRRPRKAEAAGSQALIFAKLL